MTKCQVWFYFNKNTVWHFTWHAWLLINFVIFYCSDLPENSIDYRIYTIYHVSSVIGIGTSLKGYKSDKSGSTLAQVMACCLMAPSHYLNQYWLIISKVLWHSCEGIVMSRSEDTNQKNNIENCIFRITSRFPWDQWVYVMHLLTSMSQAISITVQLNEG